MIEENLYTDFGVMPKRTRALANDLDVSYSLVELLQRDWEPVDGKKVIKSFSNDLKRLLEIDDVYLLAREIFSIEHNLSLFIDVLESSELPVPSMDRFYKNLSPIFLRAICENAETPEDTNNVIHSWTEALRIAIEEEYYLWQETLLDLI